MAAQTEFSSVFESLKSILKPYASELTIKVNTDDNFYLEGPYSEKWKRELFFGSTQIKKKLRFFLSHAGLYVS